MHISESVYRAGVVGVLLPFDIFRTFGYMGYGISVR